MSILKEKFNKLFAMGFFHIMSSNIFRNIAMFISGIIIVRIIAKDDYGTYVYANNILSYFMLLSGLGITSAIFQVCCENQKDSTYSSGLFTYGVKCSYIINLLLGVAMYGYACLWGDVFPNSKAYLLAMSFLPVVNIGYELVTIYYRSRLENKAYSYIVMVYSISSCITLVGGSFFGGVWGIIFSNYITPLVCMIVAKYKYSFFDKQIINLSNRVKHDIWKLALMSMATNAISSMMYMIDISMITTFLKDETAVASYKIASTIPSAMLLVSTSIVTFIYPYFASHIDDILWTIRNFKKLMIRIIILFVCICTVLFVFADFIILMVFGIQYVDAVDVFRILTVSLFFQGSIRVIVGNLLVTQRAVKFNVVESILTGVVNIVADYILIQKYQASGVAFSTLLVMVFSSGIILFYYIKLLYDKKTSGRASD